MFDSTARASWGFGCVASWFGAEPSLALLALQVSSSRFVAEPSLALLAPLRCSLAGGCVTVRVGDASHPPHPQKRTICGGRRADALRLACSSRYTEPSEASGEAGGTEASLRVGALDASHPPHPQKRTICGDGGRLDATLCDLLAPADTRSRAKRVARPEGRRASLRVGALTDASHPPHPQKRTICGWRTICGPLRPSVGG